MAPWDLVIKRLLAWAFTSFVSFHRLMFSFLNVAQCDVAMALSLSLSPAVTLRFPLDWIFRRRRRSSVHGHPCGRIRVLELIPCISRLA